MARLRGNGFSKENWGFDGAIHVGNGESAVEQEYEVFDLNQFKRATECGYLPVCLDETLKSAS